MKINFVWLGFTLGWLVASIVFVFTKNIVIGFIWFALGIGSLYGYGAGYFAGYKAAMQEIDEYEFSDDEEENMV